MNAKPSEADLKVIETQLGRTPRDVNRIAYRCPCGNPAVIETPPRLSDGTPVTLLANAGKVEAVAAAAAVADAVVADDISLSPLEHVGARASQGRLGHAPAPDSREACAIQAGIQVPVRALSHHCVSARPLRRR
mgnify:CR=1 FL=1